MGKKIYVLFFLSVFLFINIIADSNDREISFGIHRDLAERSLFKNIKWRNAGPYFQGGRIDDIEGYINNPYKFLIATASGGLWVTENNATTWKPIFDNESSITIGDIAISQADENLIWVGTGEQNSSRSSYAGTGIFKSINGGKTWKNMGLRDTHHIGKVIIDPRDNNIVYVAAIGHLYTFNEERGVYKTINGGKTWRKVLYINDKTGVIDMAMDPDDSTILYASSWHRERKAWNFIESGEESSIYRSLNSGENWEKITTGIPQNKLVGRIGLSVSSSNPKVIYALVDNQELRPQEIKDNKKKSGLTVGALMKMSSEDFLKFNEKKIELFLKENNAPEYINADMVKGMVKDGRLNPRIIAKMLSDANSRLLNSNVKGAEVYKSEDKGKTWKKTHKEPLSKWVYNTYGYYFGQIRVSPENENIIYVLGIPLLKSIDGGKTFKDISKQGGIYGENGVHADMQAMWIDPKKPERILLGNDGGLNISYDGGDKWVKINNIPLAQCYTVNFDYEKPYNLYTGLQDNGIIKGPSDFRYGERVKIWRYLLGGDGAFSAIEPGNSNIVYCEYQFGNIFRLNLKKKEQIKIQPSAKDKMSPYRFNWLSPFKISKHNPYTLYMGSNKMLKSVNRGDKWIEISPDLTDRRNTDGDVPYATIVSIDESSFTPEIMYAGTDDGNLWVTKNSGGKWERIDKDLPDKWVTRIVSSKFKKERVFVTLTGYRDDDFRTYVFKSENYGKDWISIKGNLPEEPVNVIREDTVNSNILYLGTDLTAYISMDTGKTWNSLKGNMPTNAVYDIKIHPEEKELIIGTHGRGIFISSLKNIQKLKPVVLAKEIHLFDSEKAIIPVMDERYKKSAVFHIFTKNAGQVFCTIINSAGKIVKKITFDKVGKGINTLKWDIRIDKKRIKNGTYTVIFKKGKEREKGVLKI